MGDLDEDVVQGVLSMSNLRTPTARPLAAAVTPPTQIDNVYDSPWLVLMKNKYFQDMVCGCRPGKTDCQGPGIIAGRDEGIKK